MKMEEPLHEKTTASNIMTNSTKPEETRIKLKINQTRKKQALSLTDTLVSLLLVTSLTIGHWRGTWELMDVHSRIFPVWQTFLFANCISFSFALIKHNLQELITVRSNSWATKILWYLLKRLYTYLYACIGIFCWHSGWRIFDEFFEVEVLDTGSIAVNEPIPYRLIISVVILHILLACLRSYKTVLGVPFVVILDIQDEYFIFPTRFNRKMEEKPTLYILDCLFSVFVIGTLVVFVWRGAWVLIDIYLFPENEYWSAWGSLVLGYAAVAIAFIIQPIMRWLCDRLTGVMRLLIADIFLFFSFVGTVNVWRGVWNVLNLYLLPDNIELSAWITHWICLILLILLKCSNTLLVRGVYIDADEPAGKCVVFPIYYLRLIFQRERVKKINKKFQIEAMTRRKIELDNIKIGCTCGTDLQNHVTKEITQNHYPDV